MSRGPLRQAFRRRPRPSGERIVVHVTTTDMSLDWLLGPQLVAFGNAGYRVVGMSAPGEHLDHLRELGVEHVAIEEFTRSSSIAADLRAFVSLVRALRRLRPDIVHTHNPKPGVLGRFAGRLTRTPLVVNTQHGLWAQPTDRRRRRWPVYAVERLAAAFSDVELVQNPEDVAVLTDLLRVPAPRVELLGNGIDLSRFDPGAVTPADRARRRADWGVADNSVLCLVVGRLVREKGIAEIIAATETLDERVDVVIVGPSDDSKTDSVVGVDTGRVRFVGRHDDMPECYAAADVFLTASWREGMPRSAMEAAAMGLPTVATDVRGNRHVVADGETGLLVEVRNPASIARAVDELATDPAKRRRLGDGAVRRAHELFDQRVVIERTLSAYDRLA